MFLVQTVNHKKGMPMLRANIICILTVLLFTPIMQNEAYAEEDKLKEFVSELPRGSLGIPFFWLEMKSLVGWEHMILLYGYADNRSACKMLVGVARKDSPDREFRCSTAN